MSINFELIGKRIQQKRKSIGKTQENMAEYLEVSVGYVSLMERGKTTISLSTLAQVADFLNCSLSDLIDNISINNSNYMNNEISGKINCLNTKEKEILYKLLETYLTYKKYNKNGVT